MKLRCAICDEENLFVRVFGMPAAISAMEPGRFRIDRQDESYAFLSKDFDAKLTV